MTDLADMLNGDDMGWVSSLPTYQRRVVEQFLGAGASPEQAATRWLSAAGPANTFPFGGGGRGSLFYEKVLDEIQAFLCGDGKYDKQRKQFLSEFQAKHAYIVGGISSAIAPALGAAAPLIAPAVALVLVVVGRITLNAWCASRKAGASNGT